MAFTHNTAARNAAADAVVDLVDGGAGDSNGDLLIIDGTSTLCSISFPTAAAFKAAGTATAGKAAMNATKISGTCSATGTADRFTIQDKSNSAVLTGAAGSVHTATGNINLSSVNLSSGEKIEITALTYTAPA